GKELIPPRGTTRLLPGDHVFIVVNRESRDPVDRIFARDTGVPGGPLPAELPLPGTATSGDLAHFYDIETGERPEVTLEQLLRQRLPVVEPGATLSVGEVRLRIREMQGDRIISVGLSIAEDE